MAVSKWFYMDQAGATQLATDIFTKVNTRIAQRITNGTITTDDFTDTDHVFSSKRLLDLIGNLANYASLDGTGNTVVDKIKAVDLRVGESTDTTEDDTVYGEIARVRALISSLTHLTYQVVTGNIEEEVPMSEAKDDVIYLQHDEPSIWVANDGYVMHDANTRASALEQDGETVYYAYYNATQNKYLKSDGTTVSSTELTSEDSIFDSENNPNAAALVEDTTYNLYIAVLTKDPSTGETTAVQWLCVGDTTIELSNYWSKSDADVANLRDLMFDEIPTATVSSIVQTAFDNTDPFPVTP